MSPGSSRSSLGMSSSLTGSDAFKFAKLSGLNYAEWAVQMQAALQSRYLWLLVTGVEACPAQPADQKPKDQSEADYKQEKKEWLEWKLRDQAAQGLMKSAAESSQWPHVAECITAKDMWEKWKKIHVTNQQAINVHYFFEELYTRKYVDGASMADHVAAMIDIRQKITAAGETLPDVHVARALVLSLPRTQSWELVKIQLFSMDSKQLTSELVSTKLQSEANRRLREKTGGETALLAEKKKHKPKKRGPKPDDVCNSCGEKGHWANKCPHNEKADKRNGGSANYTTGNLRDLGLRELGQVYMALDGMELDVKLILDCGATSHMFCDRSLFSAYVPSTASETISVGDGHTVPVIGRGSVRWKSRLPNGYRTVVLHGVSHVPGLAANLVSLGTLQRQGASVISYEGGLIVKLGHDELFRATLTGNTGTLYHIDQLSSESGVAFAVGSSGSLRLWHRRLGHANLDTIREMQRKELVQGLEITSMRDFDRVCEGCALGKSHRLPFPKRSHTTYEKMGLLVVDLTGPMSVPTWTGMQYALVVMEQAAVME